MKRTSVWTEWAVVLSTGVICPAASQAVAQFYGPEPGHQVISRWVEMTLGGVCAKVSYGDWEPLWDAA